MLLSLRGLALPAALAACAALALAPPAAAKGPPGGFRIKDEGKFFSKEALDKAENEIAAIKRDTGKDVLIETYAAIPEGLKGRYDAEGKEKFFRNWVDERARAEAVEGVVILICREPTYLIVETDRRTEMHAFTRTDRDEVRSRLIDAFEKREFDKGLLSAVGYIKSKLEKSASKSASGGAAPVGGGGGKGGIMESGILGWVCLGVGVLLALWVVFGLIRALTGAGRPVDRAPGAYGGGGYGPGYGAPAGGGGGGFMSSLLGGMLGAGAGMWAYDTFFRGGSSGPSMTPPAYGGGTPVGGGEPQPGGTSGGDWGGGGDTGGGGGDWGAGGDAGGGGGDWGAGGDTGGGGDWGGGDAGGGGGDWGGGGGGGGGDW